MLSSCLTLASANTIVDGMLAKYDNAFSLVPCGILQIGSVARLGTDSWDYERLSKWSITPDGKYFLCYL
jgi:hypothetical protein